MRKSELAAALAMAQDKNVRFIDDKGKHLEDISIFDGFGFSNFQPITCTLRQLAFLVRWQCVKMNGTIDANNLNDIAIIGRKKFTVLMPPEGK